MLVSKAHIPSGAAHVGTWNADRDGSGVPESCRSWELIPICWLHP